MNGSEAADPVTVVDVMIAAMPHIHDFDMNNGDPYDEDTADEQTDANDTEDDAIQTVEPVEESFFDTASVGTYPQAELYG
jgi:hypothetical protein